jgi:hypothetical protein
VAGWVLLKINKKSCPFIPSILHLGNINELQAGDFLSLCQNIGKLIFNNLG